MELDIDNLPHLLTPGEVAQLFRVDAKTVVRWAAAGTLKSRRTPGGHRRFDRDVVLAAYAATEPDPEAHRGYKHPGFGVACGTCSKAAGEPVAFPCGVGQ